MVEVRVRGMHYVNSIPTKIVTQDSVCMFVWLETGDRKKRGEEVGWWVGVVACVCVHDSNFGNASNSLML